MAAMLGGFADRKCAAHNRQLKFFFRGAPGVRKHGNVEDDVRGSEEYPQPNHAGGILHPQSEILARNNDCYLRTQRKLDRRLVRLGCRWWPAVSRRNLPPASGFPERPSSRKFLCAMPRLRELRG